MAFQRGVPRPPNAGRKKGSLNKLTIGRMEAAIAVEHPEYTTLQKLRAVPTIIIDRLEHTKRYTEAEGRELEALSKVLDRIMPYEHRKLSAGDTPEHPHHVNVDLSCLTDTHARAIRPNTDEVSRVSLPWISRSVDGPTWENPRNMPARSEISD